EQENERLKQENERINQELLRERQEKEKQIQEKEKEKKRANEAEAKILIVEQEKNKLNQEIIQLKEENLKLKLKQIKDKDFPIAIINPDPTDFDFTDVDGKQKKIIKKKDSTTGTVSLKQVLENGTWELEVQFSNRGQTGGIGIVKDTYVIPARVGPRDSPNDQNIASYQGPSWGSGEVHCKGKNTSGNVSFTDNQIIKAEYDSEKGTLIFFVDGVQQPVYIIGIKEKVRFIV
ncbi:MAG: hypothetical protein EZS28_045839, partial [Streblomastix strix]